MLIISALITVSLLVYSLQRWMCLGMSPEDKYSKKRIFFIILIPILIAGLYLELNLQMYQLSR